MSEGTLYSAKLVADGGAVLAERFGAVDKELVVVYSVSACTYLLIVARVVYFFRPPHAESQSDFHVPSFFPLRYLPVI